MFVRTLAGLEAAGRIKSLVNGTTRSARFLTAADGMGFSYNENRVTKGSDATLWYKHHWEANYIISGRGELTDLTTGRERPLAVQREAAGWNAVADNCAPRSLLRLYWPLGLP